MQAQLIHNFQDEIQSLQLLKKKSPLLVQRRDALLALIAQLDTTNQLSFADRGESVGLRGLMELQREKEVLARSLWDQQNFLTSIKHQQLQLRKIYKQIQIKIEQKLPEKQFMVQLESRRVHQETAKLSLLINSQAAHLQDCHARKHLNLKHNADLHQKTGDLRAVIQDLNLKNKACFQDYLLRLKNLKQFKQQAQFISKEMNSRFQKLRSLQETKVQSRRQLKQHVDLLNSLRRARKEDSTQANLHINQSLSRLTQIFEQKQFQKRIKDQQRTQSLASIQMLEEAIAQKLQLQDRLISKSRNIKKTGLKF